MRVELRGGWGDEGSVYSKGLCIRKQRLKHWSAGGSLLEDETFIFVVKCIEGVESD